MYAGRQSPASTLAPSMTPSYSQQSSLSTATGYSRTRDSRHASSLVNAMLRFSKNNMINDDLNTLIVQYVAKTGQLPIISEKELAEIPKFQFGQHINRMSGFVKSSGDTSVSTTAGTSGSQASCSFGIKKPKPIGNTVESEAESSDDELALSSWKENFMRHFNYDIKEHGQAYKKLTETIAHYRRVWKAVQTVIEKKLLSTIDEYNRLYGYEHTEKKRCENRNCHYISFAAYRKSIHKRFTTYFEEFPPFSLQRVCELLTLTPQARQTMKLNCGKLMRSLDKNIRVVTYWKPIGIEDLFEADGKDAPSECGDKTDDEDRGSIFNDTASIHSISKHSWASKSMMSPRSCGSQSPFHAAAFDDPELAIIRDIGHGASVECMNRVPSPITTICAPSLNKADCFLNEVRMARTLSDDSEKSDSELDATKPATLKRLLENDQTTLAPPPLDIQQPVSPKKLKSDDNPEESGCSISIGIQDENELVLQERPVKSAIVPAAGPAGAPAAEALSPPRAAATTTTDLAEPVVESKCKPTEEAVRDIAKCIVEDIVDSTKMDTGDDELTAQPTQKSPDSEEMSQ